MEMDLIIKEANGASYWTIQVGLNLNLAYVMILQAFIMIEMVKFIYFLKI